MDATRQALIEAIVTLADLRARHAMLMHRLAMSEQTPGIHSCSSEVEIAELEVDIATLRRRIVGLSERFAHLSYEAGLTLITLNNDVEPGEATTTG